jgi:hypothetical protein
VLAIGFSLLAHIMGWEPGKPLLLNPDIHPAVQPRCEEECWT